MMSSVLLSRFTGLFREMVLADFGGTSTEMDAYVTSFLLPELLNHFLAGGFLSITFIPIFQRHLTNNDENSAWRSFSNLIISGSCLFLLCIPLLYYFTPTILLLLGNQIKDPETFALTTKLTRIILPAQLFFYWGAFFSAVQMAKQRFLFPALSPLIYNIGIIVGGIILGPRLGIEGFAWGVLIGAFAGNILIQLPGLFASGIRFSFVCNFRDPDLLDYVKKTIPLIAGLSMTFSNEVFFRFFGSFLPPGATSSINYALRTMMMITAVFGQASGSAFYPFLVKMATAGEFKQMTGLVNKVLKQLALYLIPLSIIMIALAEPVISLLFERGRFTSESTVQTAAVLKFYLLGCFSFSASMIVCRLFYAVRNTLLPMLISTSSALLSIPLYFLLGKIMGAQGIAISASISMTVQLVILVYIWYVRHVGIKQIWPSLLKLFQIVLISLVSFPIVSLLRTIIENIHIEGLLFKNILICTICGLVSLGVIFLLYEVLKIQRISDSFKGLVRKQRK
jgi:putative peptidoglycan lipid II flippase